MRKLTLQGEIANIATLQTLLSWCIGWKLSFSFLLVSSKQIMALKYNDGRDPSSRHLKVQRGVRIFASTYLQDNLLTLPALPTREKLNKIRIDREREAEERRKEIERQLEEQRRCELLRIQEEEAAASAARKAILYDKPSTDTNPLSMRSLEGLNFTKLSSEISTFSIAIHKAVSRSIRILFSFSLVGRAGRVRRLSCR